MIIEETLASWVGRHPHVRPEQLENVIGLVETIVAILDEAELLRATHVVLDNWFDPQADRGDGTMEPQTVDSIRAALQPRADRIPQSIEVHGPGTIREPSGVDVVLEDVIAVHATTAGLFWIETYCDAWMTHDLLGAPQPQRHELNTPRLATALERVERALGVVALESRSTKRALAHRFSVENVKSVPEFSERFAGDVSTLMLDYPHYVLAARLRAGAGDEVREGYVVTAPEQRVLISLTQGHAEAFEVLHTELALEVDGIAPLRWIGEPPAAGIPYADALVEELPAHGTPAASHMPLGEPHVIAIGAAVATVIATAHAKNLVVGGICPETIYVDEQRRFAALVPRGPQFIARSPQRSPGMRSYQVPYEGHEVLALGKPGGPPNDVFAVCATLQHLATGRHPFGSVFPEILQRVMAGAPEPYPGELGKVLARGLDPAAEKRPTAKQLVSLLRSLH